MKGFLNTILFKQATFGFLTWIIANQVRLAVLRAYYLIKPQIPRVRKSMSRFTNYFPGKFYIPGHVKPDNGLQQFTGSYR
jgi:hypothetical protein